MIIAVARVDRSNSLTATGGYDARAGEAVCREAISVLVDSDYPRGLIGARNALAISLGRQGRTAEAGEELERALAVSVAAGAARGFLGNLSMNQVFGPTPVPRAIERCEQLLESFGEDRVSGAKIKRALGVLEAMAGRPRRALALIDECLAVTDELDLVGDEIWRGGIAYARELCGDRAGAERELEWMQARLGRDARSARGLIELARLHCDAGCFDDAAAVLAATGDARDFDDSRGTAVRRLAVEARLAAHQGRLEEALALGAGAIARADARNGDLNLRAGVWAAYAEVQRAAGRPDEADAASEWALALYEQKGNVAAASALRARALISAARSSARPRRPGRG